MCWRTVAQLLLNPQTLCRGIQLFIQTEKRRVRRDGQTVAVMKNGREERALDQSSERTTAGELS